MYIVQRVLSQMRQGKEKNEFKAKLNVSVKARKERKATYPTLEVGDKVKIIEKESHHGERKN